MIVADALPCLNRKAASFMHFHRAAMFDRRIAGSTPALDRRRSYVDVIERVLAGSLPFGRNERGQLVLSDISFGRAAAFASASSVQVTLLNGIEDDEG